MLSLSLITVLLLLAASSQGATSTNVWLMKLAPGAKPTQVAHKLGLTYLHAMPGGVYHAFEVSPHASLHEVAAHMDNDPLVEWHEHQMAHQQTLRGNIDGQTGADIESAYSSSRHLLSRESGGYITGQTGADGEYIQFGGGSRRLLSQEPRDSFVVHDPLYVQQWHLRGTGNSTPVNVAANVAWNMGPSYRGNGYILAIVDDGINRVHPDLASNYVSGMSYDFNSQDADPMASIGDTHGTAAAGVAAAGANTACGVGVCPDCKIASMRLIAGPSSDYMEAMALDYKSAQIGVYSNSWGPSDTGNIMGGPGSATKVPQCVCVCAKIDI